MAKKMDQPTSAVIEAAKAKVADDLLQIHKEASGFRSKESKAKDEAKKWREEAEKVESKADTLYADLGVLAEGRMPVKQSTLADRATRDIGRGMIKGKA